MIQRTQTLTTTPYRWVILLIMWLTLCVALVAQFQIAALAYQIIPAFGLTSGQYGLVLTAPMLAGMLLSFAAGALADRWGVKKVVAVGFVFSILGTFFRFLAADFLQLFLLMFLAGICPGFLTANAPKLLGAWFSREQISFAMGIYFTGTGVGMGVALATTALFPSAKSAFMTAGLAMLVTGMLWMLLIKAKPPGAPDLPVLPVTRYIGVAARSKNVWLVGLALMFFMGSSMAFTGFLPNALHGEQGYSPATAGLMASVITFGTVVGSILGPLLIQRLGLIKPLLALAAAVGAVAGISAWLTAQGPAMPMLLALMGILSGMCAPVLMSFPMLLPEIGPIYAGSAGGIIGTLQVVGAVCIPSFVLTPLAGDNFTLFFALGSLSLLLVSVLVWLLPELGAKARISIDTDLVQSITG